LQAALVQVGRASIFDFDSVRAGIPKRAQQEPAAMKIPVLSPRIFR
jgi:hypothetical protein